MATTRKKPTKAKRAAPAAPKFEKATFDGGWSLLVPACMGSLEKFREWSSSPEFPEQGNIAYLQGEIYIDMSLQLLSSHVSVKVAVSAALSTLVKEADAGEFFMSGVRYVCAPTELSIEPDASFATWDWYKSAEQVRIPTADGQDTIEMEGMPEWLMEVVSPESVWKDKERLRRLYFDAGVQEYWLIDARGERIEFEVLHRGARSFRRAPSKAGWRTSSVFGKSFKLTRKKNRVEHWTYRLEIK